MSAKVGESAREFSSRALTDTTCVLLWAPIAQLQSMLRPLGLEAEAVGGAPRGLHPIWVDMGHIRSGAGEALHRDQHVWWRRTGATFGSLLGGTASVLWGDVAEQLSVGFSKTLGTYSEAILAAPNVVTIQRRRGPYSFVLGMHTNSPVAIWGDRTLRYGYHKTLCGIVREPFASYAVRARDGQALLSAEITVLPRASWQSGRLLSGFERVARLLSQPLLGHLDGDRFGVSFLERDYGAAGDTLLAPSWVRLASTPALAARLAVKALDIPPLNRRSPWGAFSARNVPTRVTFPEHLQLHQL